MLLEERVAVMPGSAFGDAGEKTVRVSLAASEEALATGIEGIAYLLERSAVAA
jgi:aspartate/methionine/tyrosine aminotransferase